MPKSRKVTAAKRTRRRWSQDETLLFLKCYQKRKKQFESPRNKSQTYQMVLMDMIAEGFSDITVTALSLKDKMNTLLKAYKLSKNVNQAKERCVLTFPFKAELQAIFGDAAFQTHIQSAKDIIEESTVDTLYDPSENENEYFVGSDSNGSNKVSFEIDITARKNFEDICSDPLAKRQKAQYGYSVCQANDSDNKSEYEDLPADESEIVLPRKKPQISPKQDYYTRKLLYLENFQQMWEHQNEIETKKVEILQKLVNKLG